MSVTDQDRTHLERAAELGQRGWGRVHPGALVGCVMVTEEGEVAEQYGAFATADQKQG